MQEALWASAVTNLIVAAAVFTTGDVIALLGQGASLALLGYVAWKVRTCSRVRRKSTDDTGGT